MVKKNQINFTETEEKWRKFWEKEKMSDNLISDVQKLIKFLRGSKKKSKKYKKTKRWFSDAFYK